MSSNTSATVATTTTEYVSKGYPVGTKGVKPGTRKVVHVATGNVAGHALKVGTAYLVWLGTEATAPSNAEQVGSLERAVAYVAEALSLATAKGKGRKAPTAEVAEVESTPAPVATPAPAQSPIGAAAGLKLHNALPGLRARAALAEVAPELYSRALAPRAIEEVYAAVAQGAELYAAAAKGTHASELCTYSLFAGVLNRAANQQGSGVVSAPAQYPGKAREYRGFAYTGELTPAELKAARAYVAGVRKAGKGK